jgi:hypothetical protein
MTEKETKDVQTVVIKSDSSISKIVTKCLNILHPKAASATSSSPVEIVADAKVSGKAITITEIIKRRITEHGGTINQSTRVQAKPDPEEVLSDTTRQKHLQGEGYEKPRKKVNGQIIIRLDTEGVNDVN